MSSRASRAAAVLRAETDLHVGLRDVLRGGSVRAKHAVPSVLDASRVLCEEATLLADGHDGGDDDGDTRDLVRLARAVQVCVDFVQECLKAQPDANLVAAGSACVHVVAAFVHIRSGALQDSLASVLVTYVCRGVRDEQWRQVTRRDARVVVPALHVLLEGGGSIECVSNAATNALVTVAEWYVDVGLHRHGTVAEGAWAVVEVTLSVIGMAIGQSDAQALFTPLRHLRQQIMRGGKASESARADVETLLERLEAG